VQYVPSEVIANCTLLFFFFFFNGKRQDLCFCIIEEGNDPVNKENRTQKPYNARLNQGNRQNTKDDNSWHIICAGYKSP
jgi:hypothetical protein